jgi:hypothetical protein
MTRYLCPVCRAPRKTNLKDELPFSAHLRIGVTVISVSSICYLVSGLELAGRTAFLYLPLWAVSEFVHWVKMREAAKCSACGFDPVLYQRDWRAARSRVENRLGDVAEELRLQGRYVPQKLRQNPKAIDSEGGTTPIEGAKTQADIGGSAKKTRAVAPASDGNARKPGTTMAEAENTAAKVAQQTNLFS